MTGHFEELQSRYLVVIPGGGVEEFMTERGIEPLAEQDDMLLYRLR